MPQGADAKCQEKKLRPGGGWQRARNQGERTARGNEFVERKNTWGEGRTTRNVSKKFPSGREPEEKGMGFSAESEKRRKKTNSIRGQKRQVRQGVSGENKGKVGLLAWEGWVFHPGEKG